MVNGVRAYYTFRDVQGRQVTEGRVRQMARMPAYYV